MTLSPFEYTLLASARAEDTLEVLKNDIPVEITPILTFKYFK